MIYFDNSATSPVDGEVLEAMLPYLREEFGNPSSKYYCKAVNAYNAVEEARVQVSKLIGAKPEEIIFTAGATESTNFIIKGYMDYRRYYGDGKNHIITSVAEHKATLNTCKYLNGDIYSNNDPTINLFGERKKINRGYEASFVGVTKDGEAFVGAMQDVQKGVFITTSSFTKEAKKYAEKQQQKSLKLIDGDLLAELMVKYGIGLEKVQTYTVYKINEDFFE